MTATHPALQFTEADLLGRVSSVDTSRVAVDVSNSVLLTRIGIGNLIAIKGSTAREFLIAITERVTVSSQGSKGTLASGSAARGFPRSTKRYQAFRFMLRQTFRAMAVSQVISLLWFLKPG